MENSLECATVGLIVFVSVCYVVALVEEIIQELRR